MIQNSNCIFEPASIGQIDRIVSIHLATFPRFFLTFLGRGFLRQLYSGFLSHPQSHLYVGLDAESSMPLGFVAFSEDLSGFYRHLLKKSLLPLAWYGGLACLRRPQAVGRLLRAFSKPSESRRQESYVELSSIGVDPTIKHKGIGSDLLQVVNDHTDFSRFDYIKLETDAKENDDVIAFYLRNGYREYSRFETPEGRLMIEFRFLPEQVRGAKQ